MLDNTWEPSRRAKLRCEAYESTPYGKKRAEEILNEAHRVLEERLQRGEEIKMSAEEAAKHEAWRSQKGITRPPRREV